MPVDSDTLLRIYKEELNGTKPLQEDTKEEAEERERVRDEIKNSPDKVLDLPSDWLEL